MELNKSLFIEKREGKNHISLDGQWLFTDLGEKTEAFEKIDFGSSAGLPLSVGWCLYEAKKLGHPYFGTNSKDYEYIKNRIWYFKRSFFVEKEKENDYDMAYLCFDGVSYFSKVWLNGVCLGEHEGMFGGPVCEVSKLLKYGEENEIIVEAVAANYDIESKPWEISGRGIPKSAITPWHLTNDPLTQNGHFNAVGIWRSVRIEFLKTYHITNPYIYTKEIVENKAVLSLEVPVSTPFFDESAGTTTNVGDSEAQPRNVFSTTFLPKMHDPVISVSVEISDDCGNTVYSAEDNQDLVEYIKGNDRFRNPNEYIYFKKNIEIDSPKLWYPNGYGEHPLYDVKLTLSVDGNICDTQSFKTAIRTIKVVEGKAKKLYRREEHFQFVVNGREIFLKGMNFTQLDQLLRENEDDYDWVLSLAKNDGISLVRVWNGGSVPEADVFYDLCDKYGLMVWQDAYLANETAEAKSVDVLRTQLSYNLCRTRNHPSLAVFCGGNEFNPYTSKTAACMFATWDEYDTFIPDKIFYRTTPDGGSAHIYQDIEPTWYRKLYKHVPFIGESGIHGLPVYKTYKRILSDKELKSKLNDIFTDKFKTDFPEFLNHFSEFQPDRVPRMLARASHISDMHDVDIKTLTEACQMASYEFYLIMIESVLENYPYTTGIMPWVFKRPWPTSAIQIVDAYGHPHAQYYAVKRAYEDIHPFVSLSRLAFSRGEKIKLPVKVYSNDPVPGDLTVVTEVFDDKLAKFFENSKTFEKASCDLCEVAEYEIKIPDSIYDAYFFVRVSAMVDGEKAGESFYYPKVLSVFDDEQLYKKEKETVCCNMFFSKGPYLKEQICSIEKANVSVSVRQCEKEGRRAYYVLDIENISGIPAFPIRIDTVSDISRCMCDDNIFFLDKGEAKRVCVSVDMPSEDDCKLEISGWNFDSVDVF